MINVRLNCTNDSKTGIENRKGNERARESE
jgi:hypothetical protein